MNDVTRVFFHELGHFIAREINHKLFGHTEVISIMIDHYNGHLYTGDTKIKISDDQRERRPPSIEDLPIYLASSSYGCIFQSYYLNTSLKECFDQNGGEDINQWYGSLLANKLVGWNQEFSKVERDYFAYLMKEDALADFMKIEPEKYLQKTGNGFLVDVLKLRQDTTVLIKQHIEDYSILLAKYKEVIKRASNT